MEIGSFIELDLRNSGEHYAQHNSIIRLNTARAGVYHATRILGCSKIYVPYYLCSVVSDFLQKNGVEVKYYSITENFEPIIHSNETDTAFLLVNYFGILPRSTIVRYVNKFRNVIIDNCQAFFNPPVADCLNVYSARKFFGVPDGAYVIGKNAELYKKEYKQDYSSDTSLFLLKRIELGSKPVYDERMINEGRLSKSEVLTMSRLTEALLKNIDYEYVRRKRRENFIYAHHKFGELNLMRPYIDQTDENIPMVYPLMIEDELLVEKLKRKGIYTGRWWIHVLKQVNADSFEAKLSKYMIPIPIDQRYGQKEIDYINHHLFTKI